MKTLDEIRASIRVSKIVATRSVKTKHGDGYTGFTANWDSVLDDNPSGDAPAKPLTLEEAKIAHLILAMETDVAAYQAAYAGGLIPRAELSKLLNLVKEQYSMMIDTLMEER